MYLHAVLGIPDKPTTVSPHFYYQAAQWQCNNMIDMLSRSELTDKSYKDSLGNNHNTFEDDLTSIAVPTRSNVMQLGNNKTLNDFRIAKHYLSQQELLTRSYTSRRNNFYNVTTSWTKRTRPDETGLSPIPQPRNGIITDSLIFD